MDSVRAQRSIYGQAMTMSTTEERPCLHFDDREWYLADNVVQQVGPRTCHRKDYLSSHIPMTGIWTR